LKITSVKTAATSGHCMHLWVRIETDAGISGLGECVHGGHAAIAIIQRELTQKLIGRDPFAIDASSRNCAAAWSSRAASPAR